MKNIKDYLIKQAEISQELNEIIKSINILEDNELDRLYKENEDLVHQLNSTNKDNAKITKDRLALLKERVDNLLLKESTNKDPNFRKYLIDLNAQLNSISFKLNYLNEDLNKMEKKYLNNNVVKSNTKEISHKVNNTKEDSINISLNKDNKNIINKSSKNEEKLEFKLGSNVLNILGVILILIGFITFGNYIYTYYMSDMMKGLFLFAISSLILGLGEFVFSKKNPKFAIGISALGVGSLYASLIMNYLVLDTLNSMIAIVLTIAITAISIIISSKHNSNIIRVIGLIGGYGCLMPLNYLSTIESYVTIIMLLIITLFNVYIPMKNSNFTVYSSVLISIFSTILNSTYFLDSFALIIYISVTLIVNNIMYINLCKKEGYSSKQHLSLFLTSGYLIDIFNLRLYNISLPCSIAIIISAISYFISNSKLKSVFYCHGLIISMGLIAYYSYEINFLYEILTALLIISTLYLTIIHKDIYMKCASIIMTITGLLIVLTTESLCIGALYIIIFSGIIWMLSKEYKENTLVKLLKYSFLTTVIFFILFNRIFDVDLTIFITNVLSIVFVLALTNIDRLRDSNYKLANKTILLLTLMTTSIFGWFNTINALISLIIGAICLLLLTNSYYVEDEFIQKHKVLIGSLYTTYISCIFSFASRIDIEVNNLLLSVVLMTIAFANVWIGFKINILEVRKYGLILSLIVCSKLILVDFYSYNFVIKTGLFLIIGIVALAISYVYSKLEQELKLKENIDDINDEGINISDLHK